MLYEGHQTVAGVTAIAIFFGALILDPISMLERPPSPPDDIVARARAVTGMWTLTLVSETDQPVMTFQLILDEPRKIAGVEGGLTRSALACRNAWSVPMRAMQLDNKPWQVGNAATLSLSTAGYPDSIELKINGKLYLGADIRNWNRPTAVVRPGGDVFLLERLGTRVASQP